MVPRYVHITGIPAYVVRGSDGRVFLDPSWLRDLRHHTYLSKDIIVVCPMLTVDSPPSGFEPFLEPGFTFVALPPACSTLRYLGTGRIVKAMATIWRQLAAADLVFAGFVEHPIPLGWITVPLSRIRGVPTYTFLESAQWRQSPHLKYSIKFRVRSWFTERLNRLMLRGIAFAFVTQPAYEDMLPKSCPRLVSPASWFLHTESKPTSTLAAPDAREPQAAVAYPDKQRHLLFVGRLDRAKGVGQLLDALRLIDTPTADGLTVTIVGTGEMRSAIEQTGSDLQHIALNLREPLKYGPAFFAIFDGVDCLLVPSLTDEQPRIVFDAFSQGVPVLASDTTGLRSIIEDGRTGIIVPLGSAAALATQLSDLLEPDAKRWLREMGHRAYQIAQTYDHAEMHRRRQHWLTAPEQAGLLRRSRIRRVQSSDGAKANAAGSAVPHADSDRPGDKADATSGQSGRPT